MPRRSARVLAGAPGPFRDIVLLNAAAALVVAGPRRRPARRRRAGRGTAIDSGAAEAALGAAGARSPTRRRRRWLTSWPRSARQARACRPAQGGAAAGAAARRPARRAAARLRAGAARRRLARGRLALIAEIKKASPSRGLIRADFDPPALARAYAAGGAACLSVLTDAPCFQGADALSRGRARRRRRCRCLRKDFMLDPWQVVEARALGADCILLIMACARRRHGRASWRRPPPSWAWTCWSRSTTRPSSTARWRCRRTLIGINNRNLKTLAVDLATTERLAPRVPADRLLVAESGLCTRIADLERMAAAGARCFLVGESLMRAGRRARRATRGACSARRRGMSGLTHFDARRQRRDGRRHAPRR